MNTDHNYQVMQGKMQTYRMWNSNRDQIIRDAYKDGWSKRGIAKNMGISRQTVLNVLKIKRGT